MIIRYKLTSGIQYSSTITYNSQLKISISPIIFLQDILFRKKDLSEGVVPHLLSVMQKHHNPLCDLLCKYRNIFPRQLKERVPPNKKLGDVHSIPLELGMELVQKGLNHYSP